MVSGSLGSTYAWGYTLYYATNFIFTGLAVAIAFHARLFNIGGEGQAMLGRLGCCDLCLIFRGRHWMLAFWRSLTGGLLWCAVGRYPGLSSGQTRQPHRDHHDHVQLYRSCIDEYYAGLAAPQARGAMEPATRQVP